VTRADEERSFGAEANGDVCCTWEKHSMNIQLHVQFALEYILAILAGVAILIKPKLLSYIVAIYLIVIGVIGILGLKI
jgi:hypothetical protein